MILAPFLLFESGGVIYLLDYLAMEMHGIDSDSSFDGADIPENDYPAIRKATQNTFPNCGFYNTPKDATGNIARRRCLEVMPLMTLPIYIDKNKVFEANEVVGKLEIELNPTQSQEKLCVKQI